MGDKHISPKPLATACGWVKEMLSSDSWCLCPFPFSCGAELDLE